MANNYENAVALAREAFQAASAHLQDAMDSAPTPELYGVLNAYTHYLRLNVNALETILKDQEEKEKVSRDQDGARYRMEAFRERLSRGFPGTPDASLQGQEGAAK